MGDWGGAHPLGLAGITIHRPGNGHTATMIGGSSRDHPTPGGRPQSRMRHAPETNLQGAARRERSQPSRSYAAVEKGHRCARHTAAGNQASKRERALATCHDAHWARQPSTTAG